MKTKIIYVVEEPGLYGDTRISKIFSNKESALNFAWELYSKDFDDIPEDEEEDLLTYEEFCNYMEGGGIEVSEWELND